MSATILDGKVLAKRLKDELKKEVSELKERVGRVPKLVNILVGLDASACAYAKSQENAAEYIGLEYELVSLPVEVSQKEMNEVVCKINRDENVNGVMIHKPVPKQIRYREVANCIDMDKDLEGINIANIGKMVIGDTRIVPCTPAAVMEHILSLGVDLRGKEVVVVGHSEIVGKPLSLLLLAKDATVTVCHVETSNAGKLVEHVERAEVLVVAVGKASLIKGEWIKKGAIVIDVGINRKKEKIVGDVEFDKAKERAAFITPVPGGVGPVTVVMLMRNGIEAFKQTLEKDE